MDSRRVDGRAPTRRYEGSARFSSAIRARYHLPGMRAAKGPKTIAKKGIMRRASSFGLFYAAMPAKRFHRYMRYISNLYISHNIALHWPADLYSSIRDRPSINDRPSIRGRPLMRNPSQIGERMSIHPSKIQGSLPLSSIRDHPLMRNPSQIGERMSILPSDIHKSMPLSPPSSSYRDEFAPGSSSLPLTGSLPLPEWQRDNTSGWKPTDVPGYGFSSLLKSTPGLFDGDAAKYRLGAISKNGVLSSLRSGVSVGGVHAAKRDLAGELTPSGKEHPAIGSEAEPPEGQGADRRGFQMQKEEPSTTEIKRLSSGHPGRRIEAMGSLHQLNSGHPFPAGSLPSNATADRISSTSMTSLKDMPRHLTASEAFTESVPAVPPSTRDLQSGTSDSDLASSRGRLEFSRPAHRMVPSNEAPGPEEVVSITSSQRILPASGPVPFVPSAQELNRISEQVCSIIERKLQIERERRGIYG